MKPHLRRCISCGKVAPKDAFWRVVRVHPSHQLQLDRGMGRSAYLCPRADCLKVAQKKNRLGRALKATVPPSVYEILWQRLSTATVPSPPANCERHDEPTTRQGHSDDDIRG
ncbi:MAG: YlxR family protein [Cyanobacteria bacterium SID2]|nr:YlxR family protein [Cyanobacteria bacterium SID2]MBP0006118.1 YlxR family protein [Cyanobacteria bacterium SBC]